MNKSAKERGETKTTAKAAQLGEQRVNEEPLKN